MARRAAGLSALKVKTAPPGRYGDGNGLYLLVRSPEARFWIFRFTISGKMREMGLGRAGPDPAAVTLAEARAKAADLHKQVRSGIDPLEQKKSDALAIAAKAQQDAIAAITFRKVADHYIAAHEKSWRNPKHRSQWSSTLETYAYPHFGALPVAEVETSHVLAALEPIWTTKAETATRVRGRIESVLDYARSRGWRTADNPARWKGHLSNLLAARSKVAPVTHHAALPWRDIAAFMTELRAQKGLGAKALQFTILTAARSGEALGARWREVDLSHAVWTIPGSRMKAGREHRVPLSPSALTLLREMAELRRSDSPDALVFPSANASTTPLSNMAMAMVLRRMARDDLTVHGFRSTFRDWAGEATSTPKEVAEAALAHVIGNKTEAAYARGDLFVKRVGLMQAWAQFCERTAEQMNIHSVVARTIA
jgi:integrase